MIRFMFISAEIEPVLVTESTAFYHIDGALPLAKGLQVVSEEAGVLMVELVVWLFPWLGRPTRAYACYPMAMTQLTASYSNSLQLAPVESTPLPLDLP